MKSNYEWLTRLNTYELIEVFGEKSLCLELVYPSETNRLCDKDEMCMVIDPWCKICVHKWLASESDIADMNRRQCLQSLPIEEFARKFENLICFRFREFETCGEENEQKCHACIMDWLKSEMS